MIHTISWKLSGKRYAALCSTVTPGVSLKLSGIKKVLHQFLESTGSCLEVGTPLQAHPLRLSTNALCFQFDEPCNHRLRSLRCYQSCKIIDADNRRSFNRPSVIEINFILLLMSRLAGSTIMTIETLLDAKIIKKIMPPVRLAS